MWTILIWIGFSFINKQSMITSFQKTLCNARIWNMNLGVNLECKGLEREKFGNKKYSHA